MSHLHVVLLDNQPTRQNPPVMLFFCTWKDDDGRHYGISSKSPKAYFNWPGCHLCNPECAPISKWDAETTLELSASDAIHLADTGFVEVELPDNAWDWYFNISPKMEYLY